MYKTLKLRKCKKEVVDYDTRHLDFKQFLQSLQFS